jgi:hypothetical protein
MIENQHFAGGTRAAPGGRALVGEYGPEAVYLPRGTEVVPAHETNITNNNENRPTYNQNFYGLSSEQVEEIMRDSERRETTGTLI